MSADGDTVRADIVNAARTEIAKVDRGLASEPWAVRPLLQALDAALARLEAAEVNCLDAEANYLREFERANAAEAERLTKESGKALIADANRWQNAYDRMCNERANALAQRDTLAEALRDASVVIERMANGASRAECSPELDRVIAALAEAGLE